MKAKIKATGEVFNIASYATVTLDNHDSFGNPLEKSFEEVEIIQEKSSDIDWEQRRFELAKAAMMGIMGNCDENLCQMEIPKIVKITIKCADEMIKQLKEE